MVVNKESAWELDEPTPFEGPNLESVIEREKLNYITPRKREEERLNISIRNLPPDIWDIIWLIKEEYPGVDTMSLAEGCLINCGLVVLEQIFKQTPRDRKTRLEAIKANNVEVRYKFIKRKYRPIHLGPEPIDTMTVFCLSESDRSRIMEISHTYGLSAGAVTTLAMVAGIAQSVSALPEGYRERAKLEIIRFKKWMEE